MLAIVWFGLCGAVIANWSSRIRPNRTLETWSKPAATVAIAVLAVVVANGKSSGVLISALIGFAFCLAGDIALLGVVDSFIAGLAFFLIAHVAFMVMFVQQGLEAKPPALVGLAIVGALVATAGRVILRGARAKKPKMAAPVAAYLAVISTMVIIGWSSGNIAAAVGATLFVLSDAVLGWRAFVDEKPWMAVVIMMTYHGALLGLALSLA